MRERQRLPKGRIIAGLVAALVVPACAGKLEGDPTAFTVTRSAVPPPSGSGCDRAPEIFVEKCGGCHDSVNRFGNLDLDSPGAELRVVDVPSSDTECASRKLVDSTAPDRSFLIEKLTSTAPECGDPMPFADTLDPADIDCVIAWAMDLVKVPDAGVAASGGSTGAGGSAAASGGSVGAGGAAQ
jgi:hypothetical protein